MAFFPPTWRETIALETRAHSHAGDAHAHKHGRASKVANRAARWRSAVNAYVRAAHAHRRAGARAMPRRHARNHEYDPRRAYARANEHGRACGCGCADANGRYRHAGVHGYRRAYGGARADAREDGSKVRCARNLARCRACYLSMRLIPVIYTMGSVS